MSDSPRASHLVRLLPPARCSRTETSCAPRLQSAFSSSRSLPRFRRLRVDVVDVAELARVDDLLQLAHARVVLEQVADHQHARRPRRGRLDHALGLRGRLRQRLLDEAVLAGARAPAWPASACVGTGVASTTASSSGSASSSSSVGGEARAERSAAPRARRPPASASQHQRRLAPVERGEVARQVRAPVAEPDHADRARAGPPSQPLHASERSMPRVTPRKSSDQRRRSATMRR